MDKLINPLQISFVPGHHATDNVLIAHEFIHSFKKSSVKNGGLIVKIDLEKACDKVDWGFICQTLNLFKFPLRTIKLINTCIDSSSLAVMWNQEKLELFSPSHGLRQGDPLSPFLFVIYLERISFLISQTVHENKWKTF